MAHGMAIESLDKNGNTCRIKSGTLKSEMELIDSLEQILSTIRHEISNSLNSLKITIDVLRENYDLFDDRKRKDYLKRGAKILERQQQLIEAMKSYSRFNVKEQKEISFPPFWEHFMRKASDRLKDGNIKLVHHLETGPCRIIGNSIAINHVMLNILDNTIEAVEDMESPKMEIKALRRNDAVMIVMKDNGNGIMEKDILKIFIPFFTTKPERMGMGLPIARKLLSEMGGRVEIKSALGKGTEARVWLKTVNGKKK